MGKPTTIQEWTIRYNGMEISYKQTLLTPAPESP